MKFSFRLQKEVRTKDFNIYIYIYICYNSSLFTPSNLILHFIHNDIWARNINLFLIYFTNTNYGLFNNVFSSPDCVVSNGWML